MRRTTRSTGPTSGPVGTIHGLNVDLAPTHGGRLYYQEFARQVHAFQTNELLSQLAKTALLEEPPYSPEYRRIFSPWAIAAIAKESLLGGKTSRRKPARRKPIVLETVARLCEAFNSVVGRDVISGKAGSAEAILTRTAYEQFGYQESEFQELARSHALFIDIAPTVHTKVISADAWTELLGTPLSDAIATTFFLQIGANKNGGIYNPEWLDMPHFAEILETYPRSHIEAAAQRLTTDKLAFRAACRAQPPTPGFERYAYNPLVSTPFVKLDDGTIIAPQPRLIHRTITPGGLYYPGIQLWGDPFAEDLGTITEAYVGKNLALIERAEVHGEIAYNRRQKKSIDWFLVLEDLVVLIEVKSARLALGARSADAGLVPALERSVGAALDQIDRTANLVRSKDPAFSHIPNDRPIVGLVITAEPFHTANQDEFRNVLPQVAVPTLAASLRELEELVTLDAPEISSQLQRITSDQHLRQWSLGLALGERPQRRNQILDDAWNALPWPTED